MRPAPMTLRRRRLISDRSGNFTTMTALSMPFILAAAAVAIDSASLYAQRREAQALADLAAITAAANIDRAEIAVETVLRDNGINNVHVVPAGILPDYAVVGRNAFAVSTVLGHYSPDAQIPVAQRFAAGKKPFNATQVTLRLQGRRYFAAALVPPPEIVTRAIAGVSAEAAFSVGSRLLSLNGGVVNGLLSALIGTEVSLSAVDYNALLSADVDLFQFMDALASEIDLTAATYTDVLEADVTLSTIASALIRIPGTDTVTKRALKGLADAASRPGEPTLKLSELIDPGDAGRLEPGEKPGFGATVGIMQLLSASAMVADRTHQVHVDLPANIPGLAKVTLDLAVGEPPQNSPSVSIGKAGARVHTAQVRLLLAIEIGGPGGLLGTRLKLPLYLELAEAEAQLASVACASGRPNSLRVSISAKPGVLEARIGSPAIRDLAVFSRDPVFSPARIVEAPLVTVTGHAKVEMTNMAASTLTFDRDDIDNRVVKTASTHDLTRSLTQSLLGNLRLTVQIGGLGLGIPGELSKTVSGLLGEVTPAVDSVLASVLAALGIRVGEADVQVHGASCGRSVLVQ